MNRRAFRFAETVTFAAVLIITLFAWHASPAFACDPMPPPPPNEALDDATAVFSGEVTDMIEREGELDERYYDVHFIVSRVWKGVETSDVVVTTHVDQGVCGFPFEIGENYLVYASGEPDQLETALIHRTALIERADEDFAALGEGTPIKEIAPDVGDADTDASPGLWMMAGLIGLTSVLVAVIIIVRRGNAESEATDLN